MVENLEGHSEWLIKDRTACLRVGVELDVFTLIDKAVPVQIDHHRERVREPIGFISQFEVAILRCIEINRCGVTAGPISKGFCTSVHGGPNNFARIS